MNHYVIKVAEELRYNKLSRLKEKISTIDGQELITSLQSSTIGSSCILFFPSMFYEFGPYGASVHHFWAKPNKPDNYILYNPALDAIFLRKLFTGIELVIFKLCHIVLERQDREYHFESEGTKLRLKRLATVLQIEDINAYNSLFDEIWFVRDSFAHSFIDVEEIKYQGSPLKSCFGQNFKNTQPNDRIKGSLSFLEDVGTFLRPIDRSFRENQLQQIDKTKFFILCDQLLKERSLAR